MDQTSMPELARRIFASQPFTQLLGAELIKASESGVTMELPLRRELQQQHGFAHGGVISYLADNSLTFAGGMALNDDALTSEFKINYARPAKGARLRAQAEAVSVSGKQAICQCRIWSVDDDRETLCAVAQGTIVRVSGSPGRS